MKRERLTKLLKRLLSIGSQQSPHIEIFKQYINRELAKKRTGILFPFTRGVILGEDPKAGSSPRFTNGTITFIKSNTKCFGVTCSHVIERARKEKAANNKMIFQVGNLLINDINEKVICESPANEFDIATIDISEEEIVTLMDRALPFKADETSIAPPVIPKNIWCSIVGYPSQWTDNSTTAEDMEENKCKLTGHSNLILMPIREIVRNKFVLKFRNTDKSSFIYGKKDAAMLKGFGGMSGSGVFTINKEEPQLLGIFTSCDKYNLDSFKISRYTADLVEEGIPISVIRKLRIVWNRLTCIEEEHGIIEKDVFLQVIREILTSEEISLHEEVLLKHAKAFPAVYGSLFHVINEDGKIVG